MVSMGWWRTLHLLDIPEDMGSPERYKLLRRNMNIMILLITLVPLFIMAMVNYYEYQTRLKEEIVNPLRVLVNKTKHSFELFLAERLSTVSFIASAYTFEQLAEENTLKRIFSVMRHEFGGFVDLGLIDDNGLQVSYVGPYDLKGKNNSDQHWYQDVQVWGTYVSDVFMGYRRYPHVVIAVQHRTDAGHTYILRATIDTGKFNGLIASMGLDSTSDAFLINKVGVIQTPSKSYGGVLNDFPFPLPPVSYEANIIEAKDEKGRPVLMSYAYFPSAPFVLVVIKQVGEVLKSWYTLKSEIFFVFSFSVLVILLVVFWMTKLLVRRMRESDEKREAAFREMEHTHKLSSIGRLAAGVAHEINNPMAIVNEKAGLMKDLIEYGPQFPEREKFLLLTESILQSVDRCRSITHRLLGFARRMEVQIESLELNEVLSETMKFLERESMYRNIETELNLAKNLPPIASDRGQLQQVFLNILNNAMAAVEDGGRIVVTSWEKDADTEAVSIEDNGCGMSEQTLKNIFEPFFTTKKDKGTGLGLPITYGIVKKLGGVIEVQSQEGKGTTFTIFLPKKSKEASLGSY